METDDKRYLLKCDVLPRYYDQSLLVELLDRIIEKADEITGKHEMMLQYEDIIELTIERARLNSLEAAYELLKYREPIALETFRKHGVRANDFSIETVQRVRQQIFRARTLFNINKMRYLDVQKANETDKIGFVQAVVQAENILKRQIDRTKISLSEWLYIQKEIDQIIAHRNKNKVDGKNT